MQILAQTQHSNRHVNDSLLLEQYSSAAYMLLIECFFSIYSRDCKVYRYYGTIAILKLQYTADATVFFKQ